MACSPIDFFCVIRDDLIGNAGLAIAFILLLYFIISSKLRFGFDTIFTLLVPILLGLGLVIGQFYPMAGFTTFILGLILGSIAIKFFEGR